MGTKTAMEAKSMKGDRGGIDKSCERFSECLESLGRKVAKELSVAHDEVAILLVSGDGSMLKFAYPGELFQGSMNVFPASSQSIAGQTLRLKKGTVVNNASRVRHLSFYEQIRIGQSPIRQIQKMISAPIVLPDGTPIGVIQVCRKGDDQGQIGPDFTLKDLQKIADMASKASLDLNEEKPPTF